MTASPNGAAPQTFHRFTELPPELRIAIWELSLPHRVHRFPRPSKMFDFLDERWTQEEFHGAEADKRPAIAHVCSEARAVALASGSSKKILFLGTTTHGDRLSRVWVDSKRDTAVINLGQVYSRLSVKPCRKNSHLYKLLSSRDMHIALDSSWGLCFCILHEDLARKLYNVMVRGRKECGFVVLDLQLDVNEEEAASTGLFGGLGASDSVLVPIEDARQMSRLFDAQSKFNTTDWMGKWDNFTHIRKPTNLFEFMSSWKRLAAREIGYVQNALDFLARAKVRRRRKTAVEIQQQIDRAKLIRADQPKLHPLIMVSRGLRSSL